MTKIEEAQQLLFELGLSKAQQSEIAALTLLILAQMNEDTPWSQAKRQSLRIHNMIQEIDTRYKRNFEQACIIDRNPDEPHLATNSPRTHYALSDIALRTLRSFNSSEWEETLQIFKESHQSLSVKYDQKRQQHMVPLIYDGQTYYLSPGKHNILQVAIINDFGPRFAPGAKVIYLGDTADKTLLVDTKTLAILHVAITQHDKLPDVILFDQTRNWLYLIEAVTSHGPVTPKRKVELMSVFEHCPAGLVFVSAFLDMGTLRSFVSEIAWETDVWLAEMPEHMIHFNGDRFVGPHS